MKLVNDWICTLLSVRFELRFGPKSRLRSNYLFRQRMAQLNSGQKESQKESSQENTKTGLDTAVDQNRERVQQKG